MESRPFLLGALALVWAGCSAETVSVADAGSSDAAAMDAPRVDAGARDAGGGADTGTFDTGVLEPDAGAEDGGPDPGDGGGTPDGSVDDPDAGVADPDGGAEPDAGPGTDAGPPDAGDLPPTCTVTAPLDGTIQDFDDDFVFVATATDPEDGALSGPSVVWRSNRVVAPLGSGLSTTELLEPGDHVITCTATDSAGNIGTGSITVTSRSPVAAIFHPGDGETRSAGSSIPFVGQGRDFEDGMLTGSSLVWTSSLDGMIGTGTMFNRSLSAGTNVVTLAVTDADGNTGTDTITLTITP